MIQWLVRKMEKLIIGKILYQWIVMDSKREELKFGEERCGFYVNPFLENHHVFCSFYAVIGLTEIYDIK